MMKGILFNQDMVRAILDGRKSVTRRVIKFPEGQTGRLPSDGSRDHLFYPGGIKYPPYQTGSVMYVREAWATVDRYSHNAVDCWSEYIYRATYKPELEFDVPTIKWRPPIHMPKEAARLFLRVTDARVERLQVITEEQAEAEGCTARGGNLAVDEFEAIWQSTIKSTESILYGWEANPWVWVIEFEKISKEKALEIEKDG